jgi:hypothetical protein
MEEVVVLSIAEWSCVADCHEREEDSQAPPELEPINLGPSVEIRPIREHGQYASRSLIGRKQ